MSKMYRFTENFSFTLYGIGLFLREVRDCRYWVLQGKVKEKEATLQRFFQDRERQLQEAGGILSMKLQEAERRSEALQSSLNAAQHELFSLQARADDSRDARSTEVEMIMADLERANQRAVCLNQVMEEVLVIG